MGRYLLQSGISGAQPKMMIDARERSTLRSSSYIVKSWGGDYPHLGANEYFCMTAVRRSGLPTPEFHVIRKVVNIGLVDLLDGEDEDTLLRQRMADKTPDIDGQSFLNSLKAEFDI